MITTAHTYHAPAAGIETMRMGASQAPGEGSDTVGSTSSSQGSSDSSTYLSSSSSSSSKLSPPSTPRHLKFDTVSNSSPSSGLASVRSRKAHPLQSHPPHSDTTTPIRYPATAQSRHRHPSPDHRRDVPIPRTPSPNNNKQSSIPSPHVPLRKRSPDRLRQQLPVPTPSSQPSHLNGSGAQQPSPRSVSDGHPPPRTTGRSSPLRNASPSPSSPTVSDSPRDAQFPRPVTRARGLTTSSHTTSQLRRPLRLSTSIPNLNYQSKISASMYKPERGPSIPDSEQWPSHMRNPARPGYNDETRSSVRSGWTNASSSFFEASGTERSSIVTKRSSISEYLSLNPPEFDKFNRCASMSVEDAIQMYEGGFDDDPEEIDPLDLPDEGYHSQAPLSSSDNVTMASSEHRRSSTGMFSGWALDNNTQTTDESEARRLRHSRSSGQMLSGRGPSLAIAPEHPHHHHHAPVPRDRYGFKKVTQHFTAEQYDTWNKEYSVYVDRRREKWIKLMKSHNLPTVNPEKFPPRSDKIKHYIRKGVPPEWRGAAWFWYSGGMTKLQEKPGLYWSLVEQVDDGKLSVTDKETIERDLNRTFPDNIRFKPDRTASMDTALNHTGRPASNETYDTLETPILRSLRRVLQAFAVHKPSIGYCQSLNFIAGLLLLFLDEDEEKAFIMLEIITTEHLPGTHGKVLEANIDIGVLMSCIQESMPQIWAKLNDSEEGRRPSAHLSSARLPTVSLATTSWFMSLFVANFPIETVLRVWDSFFYEGSKTLFRIALAIFKVGEAEIKSITDPMEIFQVVQTIPRKQLDASALMEACFKPRNGFGHLSQKTIDARRAERRKLHAADMARLNGEADPMQDPLRKRPTLGLRRAASKMRPRNRKKSKAV